MPQVAQSKLSIRDALIAMASLCVALAMLRWGTEFFFVFFPVPTFFLSGGIGLVIYRVVGATISTGEAFWRSGVVGLLLSPIALFVYLIVATRPG